jgi:hypothetical protein
MTAGIDAPDRRGRTGLDQHGRDLAGNPRVRIREVELLSALDGPFRFPNPDRAQRGRGSGEPRNSRIID